MLNRVSVYPGVAGGELDKDGGGGGSDLGPRPAIPGALPELEKEDPPPEKEAPPLFPEVPSDVDTVCSLFPISKPHRVYFIIISIYSIWGKKM